MQDLKPIAKKFEEKLKKIKVFATDVDGILTDGRLFYSGEEMGWNRFFHALDGYGLKMMMELGLKTGIITGGDSRSVIERADNLSLDFLYMGSENKLDAFMDLQKKYGVSAEEILYIGDEFFDVPLLKRAGFSATVSHSSFEIIDCVDYVTQTSGGEGAVREVADLVRHAHNFIPSVYNN